MKEAQRRRLRQAKLRWLDPEALYHVIFDHDALLGRLVSALPSYLADPKGIAAVRRWTETVRALDGTQA